MGPKSTSDDEFVREHEAWVRGIAAGVAREVSLRHAMDDLVAYAFEGLLEARARYDPRANDTFQGFAYYRVRGAALDGAYRVRGITRRGLVSAMQANDGRLEDRGAARRVLPAEDRVEAALGELEGLVNSMADSYALAMFGEDAHSGEAQMIATLDRERVRSAVARLPERERMLLEALYFEDAALDDIGSKLELSRSWISRLHTRAIALLREQLDGS